MDKGKQKKAAKKLRDLTPVKNAKGGQHSINPNAGGVPPSPSKNRFSSRTKPSSQ